MRGRPKSFDRDQALDAALGVFWAKGYGATAVADLTESMGIGRQSLYDTFGDKHALFLEALRRYTEMHLAEMRAIFGAAGSPFENLRAVFTRMKEEALGGTCGCMMVNSSTELGADDDAAARLIEKTTMRMEQLFREQLERARDAGELTDAASPRALSRLIVDTANGLAARSRLGLDEEEIEDVFEALLALMAKKPTP